MEIWFVLPDQRLLPKKQNKNRRTWCLGTRFWYIWSNISIVSVGVICALKHFSYKTTQMVLVLHLVLCIVFISPPCSLVRAPLLPSPQELRSWEEALARAAEEQREQEEQLRRREQELAEREIDIVERELNIIIHQMYQEKPRVKKRKGHFKKSRLLKLGRDSNRISLPSGGWRRELRPALHYIIDSLQQGTNLFGTVIMFFGCLYCKAGVTNLIQKGPWWVQVCVSALKIPNSIDLIWSSVKTLKAHSTIWLLINKKKLLTMIKKIWYYRIILQIKISLWIALLKEK